jgi:hypothetical protein
VTTRFIGQTGEIVAGYFNGDFLDTAVGRTFADDAVLSTLPREKPLVSASEVLRQQFGIVTALSGMYLDRQGCHNSHLNCVRGFPPLSPVCPHRSVV